MRACVLAMLVFGCASTHERGPDASCSDPDGDGYGSGGACLGPDCRETDPMAHGCHCDERAVDEGCPCSAEGAEADCFDGPAPSEGVGLCTGGVRACSGGFWTVCRGQVLPVAELCNFLDDDCDGTADDGVLSACGDCSDCEVSRVGQEGEAFDPSDPALEVADGVLTLAGALEGTMVLRLADGESPACPYEWRLLDLSASTPEGSSFHLDARGASSDTELENTDWTPSFTVPGGEAPVWLLGQEQDAYVEVRITLQALDVAHTPALEWVRFGRNYASCTL
jgi:hypothetical protein